MYKNSLILAVIPARKKSKRLPHKNIRCFAGMPLIAWTINEAKKSKYLDKIIVNTDDKRIAAISKNYGAEVPFLRPKKLSGDSVSSEDIVLYTIKWFQKRRDFFNIVMLLQPTSPLRTVKDIDNCVKSFFKKGANSLVSITKVDKSPYLFKLINKCGFLENLFERGSLNRKKADFLYLPNGAIYLIKVRTLLLKKTLYPCKTIFYLMDKNVSIDIDTLFDFKIAEWSMLKRIKRIEK